MPLVKLTHTTLYTYSQPVALGEHRLMVRPRESFDQKLLDAELLITPQPTELRWLHDVFGNAFALASFSRRTKELYIESSVSVLHTPVSAEDIQVERYARRFPFTYSAEDMPDLARSIERAHNDPDRLIDDWARSFVRAKGATDTMAMLTNMTTHIHEKFTYLARYEKGTQTPMETLAKQRGTCRDFAVLMIEGARALGLAARFVSGYLYDPDKHEPMVGGGNTHAWLHIFLPGTGWIEFDPTNGIVGNSGLIRVAIARDPYQAIPISGTWRGFPSDNMGLKVGVRVHCQAPEPEPGALSEEEEGGEAPVPEPTTGAA
ncbi:MAG TPA: transglutaminase family protein [Polyangiales bacterium]|nr:transglutaminase family protein [Polyangiales bacterium]